jgi:pyridinium-3,5-bisthiocarboxylic acid mononucleotide nickel chelatase
MRILYYDCFSGISGDMNLGALIDLGVDKDYLIQELAKLNVAGYKIEVSTDERKGITGTKVKVRLDNEDHDHKHQNDHHHSHGEHDYHHGHAHNHEHSHPHVDVHEEHVHSHESSEHHHRNLKDVEDIINNSSLSSSVKNLSLKMF